MVSYIDFNNRFIPHALLPVTWFDLVNRMYGGIDDEKIKKIMFSPNTLEAVRPKKNTSRVSASGILRTFHFTSIMIWIP